MQVKQDLWSLVSIRANVLTSSSNSKSMTDVTISIPQDFARVLGVRVKELPRLVKLYLA